MVAEWCFCVLVDFAAHKPATLRDDGPAVLEHFAAGDGAQRAARCYVAPERLVRDLSPETGGSLRPPADVFAAGCVAAEILNGGAPTLDVAAALALARAPVDRARPPPPAVLALRPAAARAAVAAMLARDPDARGGAADHAAAVTAVAAGACGAPADAFPAAARLGRAALARPTPDARVALACRAYGGLARALGGASDADGAAALAAAGAALDGDGATEAPLARPGAPAAAAAAPDDGGAPAAGGALPLAAQLVCAALRHCRAPAARLAGLALLGRLGRRLDDEARLQTLLPHALRALDDPTPGVRAAACRVAAGLCRRVATWPSSDAALFPAYVFPRVAPLARDAEPVVAAAFAGACGALLAAARRFDAAADGGDALRATAARWVAELATGRAGAVRADAVAALRDVFRALGGDAAARDAVLPHALAALNDATATARRAACGVAAALAAGDDVASSLVAPCLRQALGDPAPSARAAARRALAALGDAGGAEDAPRARRGPVDATRGGPRVGGVAAAPVAPPGAARALLAPDQRFAGLAVRPPAGAGASDGDDGDDAVRRRHGVVDGRRPRGGAAGARPARPGRGDAPLARRVAALGVPPLPPAGLRPLRQPSDGRAFSWYAAPLEVDERTRDRRADWRPQHPGRCVATLDEHAAAVRRLAVGQDQSFVATASDDGSCRVWATARLLDGDAPPSAARYDGHGGPVLDCCHVDNARCVVSGGADGAAHVWSVELAGAGPGAAATPRVRAPLRPPRDEGPCACVAHFGTDAASCVAYATARAVRFADLRARRDEALVAAVPAELGPLSAVALGPGGRWFVVGTGAGHVCAWDARRPDLVASAWRHSSGQRVRRLATCARLPPAPADEARPLAFVACGDNEVGVWDVREGGAPLRCFRARRALGGADASPEARWALPTLDPVPLRPHPRARCGAAATVSRGGPAPGVRALMGRVSQRGASYLVTGGDDAHVRYWDLATPANSYTVSGPAAGAPRPTYAAPPADATLVVCRDFAAPPAEARAAAPAPPPPSSLAHRDAVLDLKSVDLPAKLMLSASRDGVVKCWR